MEIKYEVETAPSYITFCPNHVTDNNRNCVMVGSYGCVQCAFFDKFLPHSQTISCSYNSFYKKKDINND